jgi:hypothetical protein
MAADLPSAPRPWSPARERKYAALQEELKEHQVTRQAAVNVLSTTCARAGIPAYEGLLLALTTHAASLRNALAPFDTSVGGEP